MLTFLGNKAEDYHNYFPHGGNSSSNFNLLSLLSRALVHFEVST